MHKTDQNNGGGSPRGLVGGSLPGRGRGSGRGKLKKAQPFVITRRQRIEAQNLAAKAKDKLNI